MRVFRAAVSNNGQNVITIEKHYAINDGRDQFYQLALYEINAKNFSVTLKDSIVSELYDDIKPLYQEWVNLSFSPSNDIFYLGEKSYSFSGNKFLELSPTETVTKLVFTKSGTMAFSNQYDSNEKESSIKSYNVNLTTGSLTLANEQMVTGQVSLVSLEGNQLLVASRVIERVITLTTFNVADSGLLSISDTDTIKTDKESYNAFVNVFQASDNSNVFWLQLKSGFNDLIKVARSPDTDANGDGVLDKLQE